ncbi:glucokinase [Sphingorhabdus sp. Alg239-R122]|uniref:glucokinase n=1 Tax=Sphingorhabdus sp. Alg239-R122 TaxID=2305989 RepID=UPI0013DBF2B6|nr:glucokinase [Sphingorhabdus sp. Alg239-R122]
MHELVVADIGGTHARFAIALIEDGHVTGLDHIVKMKSADHASLQIAWQAYGREIGRTLPRDGALALAGRLGGDVIYFTNSSWLVRPALICDKLELDRYTLVNDFGAVGHAVAVLDEDMFSHICGPKETASPHGVTTIVGPGTGLGVAHILHQADGYHVTETEGGHIDFAPLDHVEDRLLSNLRETHRRVSVERVSSGPGLQVIYRTLAEMEGAAPQRLDDRELWQLALSGEDSLASAAFDRFCLCLGAVAGDLALAQGAHRVVMAGGLGNRIAGKLPESGFRQRFVAKGRFESLMEHIPVKQLLHDEPGLYGAAAAFVKEHAL